MAKAYGQKLKTLCILEILRKYTDEEHPLTASQIAEHLEEYGIKAERKSIYNDISALEEFGYDIVKSTTPRGWFLGSREFELPELYLLEDAVMSAKFISPKKTNELKKKLENFLSIPQRERRKKQVYFSFDGKCTNEEIYYTIDVINLAIEEHKKIVFRYSSRYLTEDRTLENNVRERKISPYALVWHDNHYYLIGNYEKYDNLIHIRLDRVHGAKKLEEKARHFSEVCEYKDFFDTTDYVNKLFGMHGGKVEEIEFRCNKKIIEQAVDRFGEGIFIKKVTDNEFSFSVKAALSEALVTWVMNYSEDIKVVSPQSLAQMVRNRAEKILSIYDGK